MAVQLRGCPSVIIVLRRVMCALVGWRDYSTLPIFLPLAVAPTDALRPRLRMRDEEDQV